MIQSWRTLASALGLLAWAAPATAQNAFFGGLQHQARGQATFIAGGGQLVVQNIGSSGLDGVRIDLGVSRGFAAEWDPIDPGGTLPSTALLDFAFEGALASAPGAVVPIASASIDNAGAAHSVAADFSPLGSTTTTVEVLGGDVALVTVTGHVGPVGVSAWPDEWSVRAQHGAQSLPCLALRWKGTVTVDIPGAGSFDGTEIVLSAEGAAALASVNTAEVLATDVPSFTLKKEEVEMFDLFHTALGNSAFNLQPDLLIVSNIGSSGLDGYSVDISDVERGTSTGIAAGMRANWVPLDAGGPLPAGAALTVSAKLSLAGIPSTGVPLLTLTQAGAPGIIDVDFDLAPIQATSYLVDVYQGGALIAREVGVMVPGTVTSWPTGARVDSVLPNTDFVTYTLLFQGGTTLDIPGVGNFTGDELRFGMEGTKNKGQGLFDFRLRGANLPAIVVTSETANPALPPFSYCSGKANSCGGTPSISSVGVSSATQSAGFVLTGSNARFAKSGLVIYTNNGPREPAVPFQGGLLCINGPVRRGPASIAQGGSQGQCNASFAMDMNGFAAGVGGGNPQGYLKIPGTAVDCQWWGRDTQANGSYLSDALRYVVGP